MTESYKAPSNVSRLQTPKTNPDVWELLNKGHQIVDSSTQRVQSLQVGVMSAVTRMVDAITNDTAGPLSDYAQELTDVVTMHVMSFNYLSQIRKDVIRNALGYPLAKFCAWDTPVGADLLFENLAKRMKDKDETQLKLRRRNRYAGGNYGGNR